MLVIQENRVHGFNIQVLEFLRFKHAKECGGETGNVSFELEEDNTLNVLLAAAYLGID